mgnify:CR=1 FL=1
MKLFVSCSHRQGDGVWGRLVPILTAGGAELLIDDASLRVLVRPGTLPSAPTERPRHIAQLIEKDRCRPSERLRRRAPTSGADDASAPADRVDAGGWRSGR